MFLFHVVYALECSFLDLCGSCTPWYGGFHVFMLFIFSLLSHWFVFSRGKVVPHSRMYFLAQECISSCRDANPHAVCNESSHEAMQSLVCSDAKSHRKLETNALPHARNKGYLGLSNESLEVCFGHPFGFYTFLVQNRFPKGFKIYRLSIRWHIFNSLYLRYILIYAMNILR